MLKKLIRGTYFRYKRYLEFDINKTDVVLDIGSGGSPFSRSDILLDISTKSHKNDIRPFVQANICDLPFYNKSIDFIYCYHVLEHVDNPKRALDEIQRVGKRGYIGLPSAIWEMLFGDDNEHKWFIEMKGDQLLFNPKNDDFFRRSESARNSMRKLFKLNPKGMGRFYRENFSQWGIEYKWLNNINFVINPGTPRDTIGAEFWDDVPYPKSITSNLYNFARSFETSITRMRRKPWQLDLTKYLRCSICKGKLIRIEKGFHCQSCGVKFKKENDIIKMLA